jgi:glycosyltransferase involved in cell wall biosynthesis
VLNHNYARFLPECLDSILAQTFASFEVVLIDDASTDDSAAVIERYVADERVRVARHSENRGFTSSLIEGTEELSRGRFLTVISADDLVLDREAFGRQVAALEANPAAGLCASAYLKLGPGQERELRRPFATPVIPGPEAVRALLTDRECSLLHSGTVIRRETYRAAGGYDPALRNYVDLALWVALGALGSVAFVDAPLYGYRIHGSQFSGSGDQRRAVLREGVAVCHQAIQTARAARLDIRGRVVMRARISDLALADAFAGRRTRGLQRCWDAIIVAPAHALTAPGWWIALARALAGTRGWRLVRWGRRCSQMLGAGFRRARRRKAASHRAG